MKNPTVAGALFDFLGDLTSGDELTVGGSHECTPALDRLKVWADRRGLDIEDADVQNWSAPNRLEGTDD